MATRTAKKNIKRAIKSQKVNDEKLTKNLNKIKDTAKDLNTQVMDTATVVIDDLKNNREQIREAAMKNVKEAINKVNETVSFDNLKDGVKTANKFTLKTADEIVEGAIENGEKLQVITTKAVNGGLKLAAKQQDIVFTTLEALKGQMADGALRFKKLLRS